jgi:hypothetical protein
LVHAGYLSIDALTARARKRYYKAHPGTGRLTDWLGPVVTFHLAALAFIFFRAATVADAWYMLGHLRMRIGAPSAEFLSLLANQGRFIILGFGAYFVCELADYLRRHGQQGQAIARLPLWRRWIVYYCTTVAVVVMTLLLLGTPLKRVEFVYAMF